MNERIFYERRQIGYVTLVALFVAFALVGVAMWRACPPAAAASVRAIFLLLIIVGTLFSTMTVRVTESALERWFGIKAIGRRVPLREIESLEAIRTTIWEGWGIHLTWHGWVWNVSGFNAVQVRLRSGTRYAVGTPEPNAVIAAIETARSARS